MSSRKDIWAGMDRLEGKKVGSSHVALNKERVRQGYKPEGGSPHSKALEKAKGGISKGKFKKDPRTAPKAERMKGGLDNYYV